MTNDHRLAQAAKLNRAAILSAVYERNRIRRDAHLPLLDIRNEFEQAVSGALDDAYGQLLERRCHGNWRLGEHRA